MIKLPYQVKYTLSPHNIAWERGIVNNNRCNIIPKLQASANTADPMITSIQDKVNQGFQHDTSNINTKIGIYQTNDQDMEFWYLSVDTRMINMEVSYNNYT